MHSGDISRGIILQGSYVMFISHVHMTGHRLENLRVLFVNDPQRVNALVNQGVDQIGCERRVTYHKPCAARIVIGKNYVFRRSHVDGPN